MGSTHFDQLESEKENIQSLRQGRSASRLVSSMAQPLSNTYDTRMGFEKQIRDEIDELDDPLQLFLDYIEWIYDNYPSPTTRQSGLPDILERCIEYCKGIESYKNDIRFVRLWIQYIDLFITKWEEKREIYVYMMRLRIGNMLAIFYETFSDLLIEDERFGNALDLLQQGISQDARPVARLVRAHQRLITNLQTRGVSSDALPRNCSTFEIYGDIVLGKKRSEILPNSSATSDSYGANTSASSSGKLKVFIDNDEDLAGGMEMYQKGNPKIQSFSNREKENKLEAIPLRSGSTITPIRQGELQNTMDINKIPVFQDNLGKSGPVYKIIEVPGRKPEKIQLNFNLIYPNDSEEYCIEEILAIARSCYYKKPKRLIDDRLERETGDKEEFETDKKRRKGLQPKAPEYQKITTTSILPLKGDAHVDGFTTINSDGKPRSPTATIFSNDAMNEVYSMFNQNYQEVRPLSDNDDTTTGKFTIFENFTQDFTNKNLEDLTELKQSTSKDEQLINQKTPAKEKYSEKNTPVYKSKLQDYMTPIQERTESTFKAYLSQDDDITGESRRKSINSVHTAESSPFLTQPQRVLNVPAAHVVENPLSVELRKELLRSLQPPLNSYDTYFEYSQPLKMSSLLKKIHKVSKNMNKNPIVDFKKTNDLYCIRRELGEGGYATVYLAESSTGQLRALKVEKPASVWEFYILKQIERRVPDESILKSIINVSAVHCFQDESYLVLNYASQGTILDLINWERERSGSVLDESLCMFIAIELMRVVECIHDVGIIHGDIKPDNCMIRFQKTSSLGSYNSHGDDGWSCKGIYLIDFGRSFDLSLFPLGTRFRSNWKTDQQDCPEMREGRPWSYEADYYGLAGVIHSMLFGEYIEVIKVDDDKYQLKSTLKRYWQQDIWGPLFDLLINTGAGYTSVAPKLRSYRNQMSTFLEREASSKLRNIVQSLESDLEAFKRAK